MRRAWLPLLVVVILLATGIGLRGDAAALGDEIAHFAWWTFAAALLLALGNYAIRWRRWQYYLRRVGVVVPTGSSALIFGAGLSLAISPAKVGEVIKSFLLDKLHDVPATSTAPLVVAERVTDLLALLILSVIGVAAYGFGGGFVIAAAAGLTAGLVLLAWPAPMTWLVRLVTAPRATARFREPLLSMYAGLTHACAPAPLAIATALAIPAWLCECLGFSLILRGFQLPGVEDAAISLGVCVLIYAVTTIAGALSFLPGGLGVTEAGMTVLLMKAGGHIARPMALAATLLTRLATLWFAVALGLVCLAVCNRRISRRARQAHPLP